MYDQELFNVCRDYTHRKWGNNKTAYSIEDDGSRTPIYMGHHELIRTYDNVEFYYGTQSYREFLNNNMARGSISPISSVDNFNLDYMLEETEPREPNSPVSHMLRNPVIDYQSDLRENAINELL